MSEPWRALLLPIARVTGAVKLPALIANPFATHRVPLHAPNFPLVLLYTAKAGSGSLIKWFLFQSGGIDATVDLHRGVHDFHRTLRARQAGYGWEALRLIVCRERPIFKLVRNPYDRAVSSFLAMLFHTQDNQRNPWGRKPIAAARRLSGKSATAEPRLSFRDFLCFLEWSGTKRGKVNGHLARQHVAGEDRCIDRLIRLERFVEEIRAIEGEFRLARSPLALISSPHNQRPRLQEAGDHIACVADIELTSEEVRRGHFPAYEAFYDEDARRVIRECFAADFRAYGYDS